MQGAFEANWHWAAWAVSGIVLGAAYLLWLYQRTMFGPVDNPKNQELKDLNLREVMTLVPLILWAFWIGLYPKPYFDVLREPVQAIVQSVHPDFYPASAKVTTPTAAAPQVNAEADPPKKGAEPSKPQARAKNAPPSMKHRAGAAR